MPDISGTAVVPYGHPSDFTVYINEQEYMGFSYLRIVKGINQLESFEINIYDVTASDTNVAYGKIVKIFAESTLLLKGRVEEVKYQTDGSVSVKGYGMAILLQTKELASRVTLTDSIPNLANYFLSLNNDSTSPWVITPSRVDDFGEPVILRCEFDNKLQTLDNLARQLEWDWWVDNGYPPYETDTFNVGNWRGSLAPVYDVYLSGTTQNAIVSDRNDNFHKLYNSIIYLGKGEGASQIWTGFTFSSTVWDRLDQSIVDTNSYLVLITGTDFPSAGVVLVGRLPITYTAKTGNIMTVLAMDTENSALNTYHYRGTLCTLLYDATGQTYTALNNLINSTDTTIGVNDASSFAAAGSIIVGTEVISYTEISGNDFTGCVRGASNTAAVSHDYNVTVFQYDSTKHYTSTSPQTGSSIALNGLKQAKTVDSSKESERQIEMEASNWLIRNNTITYEITFEVMDYFDFLNKVKLGDRIRMTDSDTGLSGELFRFLGLDLTWNGGATSMIISASNKKITESTFVDKLAHTDRMLSSRLTYSQ
jgi:hypothetical protein